MYITASLTVAKYQDNLTGEFNCMISTLRDVIDMKNKKAISEFMNPKGSQTIFFKIVSQSGKWKMANFYKTKHALPYDPHLFIPGHFSREIKLVFTQKPVLKDS